MSTFWLGILMLITAAVVLVIVMLPMRLEAATAPSLGTAGSFAVLAGSAITNVPASSISGDVGLSPAAGTNYDGLTSQEVSGTIYAVDTTGPDGIAGNNPGLLTTAKNDLTAAYGSLSTGDNTNCDVTFPGVRDLTLSSPLGPGVYCAVAFIISGDLVLEGSGVWIFRASETLTTAVGTNVTGGSPCDVWWQIGSSATLFTDTAFIGNILASASITLQNAASVSGRVLAQNGAVTLDNNVINAPDCSASPTPTDPDPTATEAAAATATQAAVATATQAPVATATQAAAATATQAAAATATQAAVATATQAPAATATQAAVATATQAAAATATQAAAATATLMAAATATEAAGSTSTQAESTVVNPTSTPNVGAPAPPQSPVEMPANTGAPGGEPYESQPSVQPGASSTNAPSPPRAPVEDFRPPSAGSGGLLQEPNNGRTATGIGISVVLAVAGTLLLVASARIRSVQ